MNEHIYTDKDQPALSLVNEQLSDGSPVWKIILREKQVDCLDERRARAAMLLIAAALKSATCGEVLHV